MEMKGHSLILQWLLLVIKNWAFKESEQHLLMNGTGPTRRKARAIKMLPTMDTTVGYLMRSQIWEIEAQLQGELKCALGQSKSKRSCQPAIVSNVSKSCGFEAVRKFPTKGMVVHWFISYCPGLLWLGVTFIGISHSKRQFQPEIFFNVWEEVWAIEPLRKAA